MEVTDKVTVVNYSYNHFQFITHTTIVQQSKIRISGKHGKFTLQTNYE